MLRFHDAVTCILKDMATPMDQVVEVYIRLDFRLIVILSNLLDASSTALSKVCQSDNYLLI